MLGDTFREVGFRSVLGPIRTKGWCVWFWCMPERAGCGLPQMANRALRRHKWING